MEGINQTHLVFRLNRALFALDAPSVREVLPLPAIAAVEETPPYVVGVINLRGRVVPVLDLNLRFGHATVPGKPDDALIIVEVDELLAGIIVSEALDVVDIPPNLIEPPPLPESPERIFPPFVTGNARVKDELVMVLDHRLLIHWVDQGDWLPELLPGGPDEAELIDVEPGDVGQKTFRQRALALQVPLQDEEDEAVSQLAAVLLGGEFFGIKLSQVLQFAAIHNLTPLPNCPQHIVGILNLRGMTLTVLDLRGYLGLPSRSFASSAQVVMVKAAGLRAAIVVDDIHDILSFRMTDLVPSPATADFKKNASILGTFPYLGKSLSVIDLDILFSDQELVVKTVIGKDLKNNISAELSH